jgi:hypothetical protein
MNTDLARQQFLEKAIPILKSQLIDIEDPKKETVEENFKECMQMKVDSGEIS